MLYFTKTIKTIPLSIYLTYDNKYQLHLQFKTYKTHKTNTILSYPPTPFQPPSKPSNHFGVHFSSHWRSHAQWRVATLPFRHGRSQLRLRVARSRQSEKTDPIHLGAHRHMPRRCRRLEPSTTLLYLLLHPDRWLNVLIRELAPVDESCFSEEAPRSYSGMGKWNCVCLF